MSEVAVHTKPLTPEEDTFALGIIEFGGNIGAAYRAAFGEEARNPVARGRELLTRPEIALRVRQLGEAVQENALISLGSHLTELARIRDLAVVSGQLSVAMKSEVQRGVAAGLYIDKTKGPSGPDGGEKKPSVAIFIGGPSPANVNEWAANRGRAPVIIENGK